MFILSCSKRHTALFVIIVVILLMIIRPTTKTGYAQDQIFLPIVANDGPTATHTPTATATATNTSTPTPANTPTPTSTSTSTPTNTPTSTVTPTFTVTPTETPEPEKWTALFLSPDEMLLTSVDPNISTAFYLYPFPESDQFWHYELKGDITNPNYQFHLNMRSTGPVTVQAEVLLNNDTLVVESFDVDSTTTMQFNRIALGVDPNTVTGDILTLKMILTAGDPDDSLVITGGSFPNYSNLAVALENP